ncbi:hypothetical protein SISNIDRAFT_469326 [Sistotremastrum niveocremeum HHB9708]|uniref:Uncharacterized protein n=1 Tax=Sistotremastrum niveocremeum HHB9708 TaxID=1314777 RepID=A0A164QDT2_9AGAM|nr:hypothetical protein SISNIDRAFT_469326 [Sistotremastrum niveocremeum HHB9708]
MVVFYTVIATKKQAQSLSIIGPRLVGALSPTALPALPQGYPTSAPDAYEVINVYVNVTEALAQPRPFEFEVKPEGLKLVQRLRDYRRGITEDVPVVTRPSENNPSTLFARPPDTNTGLQGDAAWEDLGLDQITNHLCGCISGNVQSFERTIRHGHSLDTVVPGIENIARGAATARANPDASSTVPSKQSTCETNRISDMSRFPDDGLTLRAESAIHADGCLSHCRDLRRNRYFSTIQKHLVHGVPLTMVRKWFGMNDLKKKVIKTVDEVKIGKWKAPNMARKFTARHRALDFHKRGMRLIAHEKIERIRSFARRT